MFDGRYASLNCLLEPATVGRGAVLARRPQVRPRLLLPCNWLPAEEAEAEDDI